ncbi:hypothetical protein BDZ45DRAFT_696255 [Acephala macrosclerotiorum]|nr:hypothetical protein BDZ45DRAFT_696255 [Acephala macrosclerotiorum]
MGFSDSCTHISLNGLVLSADCTRADKVTQRHSSLDLDRCLFWNHYTMIKATSGPHEEKFRLTNDKKVHNIHLDGPTMLRADVWTKGVFSDSFDGCQLNLDDYVRNRDGFLEFKHPKEDGSHLPEFVHTLVDTLMNIQEGTNFVLDHQEWENAQHEKMLKALGEVEGSEEDKEWYRGTYLDKEIGLLIRPGN